MATLVNTVQATAQWQELVKEAEQHVGVAFNEEVESYLVFLLMRYTQKPEIAAKVLALEYLQGMQRSGSIRQDQLRDVGDQCLLYSGLFPKRAERRRVKVSYYVDLGRSAYHHVAEVAQRGMSLMFHQLAERFVEMMDTLQAMRIMNAKQNTPVDLLQAFELWQDTGSTLARVTLAHNTKSVPVWYPDHSKHKH